MSQQTQSPSETTIMVVWPTIGAMRSGRLVGQLCGIKVGVGFFTLGKLLALACIPLSIATFAWQLMPVVCRRYKLTTRRIVIGRGLTAVDGPSVALDEFDAVEVDRLPGQDFLHSGDLVFKKDGSEVFRLAGVSRPEVFLQVCLKAQTATLSVAQVVAAQMA